MEDKDRGLAELLAQLYSRFRVCAFLAYQVRIREEWAPVVDDEVGNLSCSVTLPRSLNMSLRGFGCCVVVAEAVIT